MVRIKPEALAVAVNSLLKTPKNTKWWAAVVEVIWVRGIDRNRPADQCRSIDGISCPKSDGAEKMQGIRVIRIFPKNLAVELLGLSEFSFSLEIRALLQEGGWSFCVFRQK